jgi:glycosyltransferase involved in cell wall biosynthesis
MQALSQSEDFEWILLTDRAYEMEKFPRSFILIKEPLRNESYIQAAWRIVKTIIFIRPRLIHVQTMLTARRDWILFLIGRIFNINIVYTAHNIMPHEDLEKEALFMKAAFRIIYGCSKKIIVHSAYSKNSLIGLFKVPEKKINIIPHGNYLFMRTKEIPQSEARKRLDIPSDAKVVLHFGAVRPYKGIDTLLYAFKELAKAHDDVLLLVVGKAMNIDIGYYEDMANKLGLGARVIFRDEYISFEEIPAYFFASDIAVFPYKDIDMSGSLQLAYAFAKPVVATRSGGLVEVVEEGRNGITVQPGDTQAFSKAMEKILYNEDLKLRMGEASFRMATSDFSWTEIAHKTADVYRGLTKKWQS